MHKAYVCVSVIDLTLFVSRKKCVVISDSCSVSDSCSETTQLLFRFDSCDVLNAITSSKCKLTSVFICTKFSSRIANTRRVFNIYLKRILVQINPRYFFRKLNLPRALNLNCHSWAHCTCKWFMITRVPWPFSLL